MIRVNLNKYIEKLHININQLSKETGISRKALTSLANYNDSAEPPISIQYHTIETLCKYFKIGVDDLLSYEYKQSDFAVLPISINIGKDGQTSLFVIVYNSIINGNIKNYFIPIVVGVNEIKEPESFVQELPKELAEKMNIDVTSKEVLTPRYIDFSFEVVLDRFFKRVEKYLKSSVYYNLIEENDLIRLSDEEIAYLMKSFSKSFLAELTARFFEKHIITLDNIETQVSMNWNFGYYSYMNSGSFHFEYSIQGDQIVSMNDDFVSDPFDGLLNYSDEIEKNTHPAIFTL